MALGRQLADLEDVVDQMVEVLDELRAQVADESTLDATELIERMEAAFVRPSDGHSVVPEKTTS